MRHHETPTARALKLTVHMIAVLFAPPALVNPATRKALVSRGLAVVAGKGLTLTDEGERVRGAIESEVLDHEALSRAEGQDEAPHVTPAVSVELPSGESLEIPSVVLEEDDEALTADPGVASGDPKGVDTSGLDAESVVAALVEDLPAERRTIRARDVKAGMTIGLVGHGEPPREVIVTDVRWIGAEVTIRAGSVEVTTEALTLFCLVNDGSLFESDQGSDLVPAA